MIAAIRLPRFSDSTVRPGALRRALIAGFAWGATLTVGFAVMNFWSCGVICLSEVAINAAIAIPAGIAVIGPLAAFANRQAVAS